MRYFLHLFKHYCLRENTLNENTKLIFKGLWVYFPTL